jgi:hypothetical protein
MPIKWVELFHNPTKENMISLNPVFFLKGNNTVELFSSRQKEKFDIQLARYRKKQ